MALGAPPLERQGLPLHARGRTIKAVGRLGKYLLLALDNGDTLVVHLGMSGHCCG